MSLQLIQWIGSITALQGAGNGLVSHDIKKIIAYSTTSQQGYMMVGIGISAASLSMFHLCNHAFFKSLLFQTAGAIIHNVSNQQDIRKYGGQLQYLPLSYITILIGNMSQMAFPFMTGFFSKDYQIQELTSSRNITSSIGYLSTYVAAILTASYSIRLLIMSFYSKPHYSYKISQGQPGESDRSMSIVLQIQTVLAIVAGYLTHDYFLNSFWYNNSITILPNNLKVQDGEAITENKQKQLPAQIYLQQIMIIPFYTKYPSISKYTQKTSITEKRQSGTMIQISVQRNLHNYNHIINNQINKTMSQSQSIYRNIDRGIQEQIGGTGIIRQVDYMSTTISMLSTGKITDYLSIILSTVAILLVIVDLV